MNECAAHLSLSMSQEMLSKSEKDFLDIVQEKDRLLTQLRNDNDQLRTSCMSLQEQLKQVSGRDQSDTIKELNSLIQGLTTEKSRLYEQVCERPFFTGGFRLVVMHEGVDSVFPLGLPSRVTVINVLNMADQGAATRWQWKECNRAGSSSTSGGGEYGIFA